MWFNLQKPSVYTISRQKGCEVHVDVCHISLFRSNIRLTLKPSFLPHFTKISVPLR